MFYRIGGALSLEGVPPTDRDADGRPLLTELWEYLPGLDPARGGCLSPELKDLLNKMFDVDPKRRMTIEEVCEHPWLTSHQAPGDNVPEAALETESERTTYVRGGFILHTLFMIPFLDGCACLTFRRGWQLQGTALPTARRNSSLAFCTSHHLQLAEMKRRFTQYVERKYPRRVGYRVRDTFTLEVLEAAIAKYSSDRPFTSAKCDKVVEVSLI
jgi:serine/threonine protein kinase